jgi:arylsulfatase
MSSRSERAPFLWTALSSALSAACLNLAASALDHPRALASCEALGLPLAAGLVLAFAVALPVFALLGALGRGRGIATGPLDAATYALLVLAAALAPLVEAGMRGTTPERAGVVVVCAAGFVVSTVLAVHALARRIPEGGERALVLVPLVAAAVLAGLWSLEYHAERLATRGLVLALCAAGVLASARAARTLAARPVLASLSVLVLIHAGFAALHDPRRASPSPAPHGDRTPVLLITVDTLRADRVLGEPPARVPTPAIDRLLADSVVFTQARAAAPWTKPSLATILTGLSPLVHGTTSRRARLPAEVETLAERLRAAGYRTGGLGLNAHLERAFGFDQGFDDYAFPARPDYGISLGARLLERLAPSRYPELFPSTTAIAGAAADWIDAHAGEPFFLWLHVLDPHWPYEPPARWLEHAEREPRRWGEPEMVTNVQAGNLKPGQAERVRVGELYAGEIRYVDAELARVLGTLRERGLYDHALIAFASDHGEEFWEHGRYEHGHTLYDEVLRVPLAFKLPGATAGARVDAPVSTAALAPTVLDVLGVPFEEELMSTRSLAAWWRGSGEAVAEPLFASSTYYFGEKRGVVFGGRKLVLELDTGRSELYDLARDPRELASLAAAAPDVVREGLRLLAEWQEGCAALRAKLGLAVETDAEPGDEALRAMRKLGYAGTQ